MNLATDRISTLWRVGGSAAIAVALALVALALTASRSEPRDLIRSSEPRFFGRLLEQQSDKALPEVLLDAHYTYRRTLALLRCMPSEPSTNCS